MNNQKLHQEHGSSWREFRIEDGYVAVTVKDNGAKSVAQVPFGSGLVLPDYDEDVIEQRSMSSRLTAIWTTSFFASLLAAIVVLGQSQHSRALTLPGVGLGVLTCASLIGLLIKAQPKKIPAAFVYMGNERLTFYHRDDVDRHNINAFVQSLLTRQKAFFKQKYLAFNPAMSEDEKKARLSWLFEHHIIDHHELTAELQKITEPKTKPS